MKIILPLLTFLLIQLSAYSQEKSRVVIEGNDTLLLISKQQAKECLIYKKDYHTLVEILVLYEDELVPQLKQSVVLADSMIAISERETEYEYQKYLKTVDQMDEQNAIHKTREKKLKRQRNFLGAFSLVLLSIIIIK